MWKAGHWKRGFWLSWAIHCNRSKISRQAKTHPFVARSFWRVRNSSNLDLRCQQTSRPWGWVRRLLWQDNNTGKRFCIQISRWIGNLEYLHSSWRPLDSCEYSSILPFLFCLWRWSCKDKDCEFTIGDQQLLSAKPLFRSWLETVLVGNLKLKLLFGQAGTRRLSFSKAKTNPEIGNKTSAKSWKWPWKWEQKHPLKTVIWKIRRGWPSN